MDIEGYYRSLQSELNGLQDRVRHLIGGAHWPTDGGWKESVLRATIRRSLGSGVEIGQGFFVTSEGQSPQIDILAWRADSPVLFRDGSLVVVPGAAVRGIYEVKTRLSSGTLIEGLEHLAEASDALRIRHFVQLGLFAYESDFSSNQPLLARLRDSMSHWSHIVDLLCHGPDRFIRYWNRPPSGENTVYEKWHSYNFPGLAYGYFINNVVGHLAPDDVFPTNAVLYPKGGKEPYKDGEIYRRDSIIEALESTTLGADEHD